MRSSRGPREGIGIGDLGLSAPDRGSIPRSGGGEIPGSPDRGSIPRSGAEIPGSPRPGGLPNPKVPTVRLHIPYRGTLRTGRRARPPPAGSFPATERLSPWDSPGTAWDCPGPPVDSPGLPGKQNPTVPTVRLHIPYCTDSSRRPRPAGPEWEGHPSIYVAPWPTARRAHDARHRFEGAGTLTMRYASGRSLDT